MINELISGPAVPDAYLGVWKRTLLRTPKVDDTTTRGYWMQTKSWHADIRIPANRPTFSGKVALAQLNHGELMELARQQGFCGTTVVDDNICHWLRRYDYQPPSNANVIGRMQFETPDRVLEFGIEADYFEIWERLPGSQGETLAIRRSDDPPSLILCAGGVHDVRAAPVHKAACRAQLDGLRRRQERTDPARGPGFRDLVWQTGQPQH